MKLGGEGGRKEKEPHQCVVEANVSFQAGANMVELHNGYFCRRDGQYVLHTLWQSTDVKTSGALIVCFI